MSYKGTKMYHENLQEEIRKSGSGDVVVQSQQHFMGNLPHRSLLGKTHLMFQFVWALNSLGV